MKWTKTNILLLTILIILQVYMLALVFRHPMPGMSIREETSQHWVISSVDRFGIATSMQLNIGDHVLAVNGVDPSDYWSVKKWGSIDQIDNIIINRNGVPLFISIEDVTSIVSYDLFSVAAEIASVVLAIVIYRKLPQFKSSKHLSIVFLNIYLIFMSLAGSSRGDPTGKIMITVCMMLLPFLFYHFLMVFFEEKGVKSFFKFPVKGAYLIIITLVGSVQLVYYTPFYTAINMIYNLVTPVTLGIGVLGMLLNFVTLFKIFAKYRNYHDNVSIIVKTVLVALVLSFLPIITFSFLPKLLFGHEWLNSFYMSWFVFIFPLTFVYLLATRRLYDIDIIMRRLLLTFVISLVPSLLFTAVIKLLALEITTEQLVLLFMSLLVGMTLLLYSLENLTLKLEPVLFPRKHLLQNALKNISKNLGNISSLREMKEVILTDIVGTLEVMGGAIAYCHKDGSTQIIIEGTLEEKEIEALVNGQGTGDSGCICFEVSRQEEFTSFLVISQKKAFTTLGLEEVQWLNLIISYLAVSMENIHLIQKLNDRLSQLSTLIPDEKEAKNLVWFRKLMFELQEKERVRIATDLHDTTMQDLFFLKGRLQHIQDRYPHPKEEDQLLESLTEYIDVINVSLRQSCFELHPYLLREVGLVNTLHKLFKNEESYCNFQISFVAADHTEIERQDMETKRHLFRLVQELLNNAKKHSQAEIVRFSLYMEEGRLCFEYMDDGVGFDMKQLASREIGSTGIGMEQMKGRILSLGGQYELESAKGQGMRFQVSFPVELGKHTA